MEGFVPELMLGAVSVIVATVVIVESLKRLDFVSDKSAVNAQKAAVLVGFGLGLVWLATQLFPVAASYIVVAVLGLIGGLNAGLAYDLAGRAFFARLQKVTDALFGAEK